MPLLTTAIGAFPKPGYVALPDWFSAPSSSGPEATVATSHLALTSEMNVAVEHGVREVVELQVEAGVDIPTDGEVRRENYVHYHCRHLDGIDFTRLTSRVVRDGTWAAQLPTVVAPITPRGSFLDHDFRLAQSATTRPVKMTMPGPMTIMDTTANEFYRSELEWGHGLAEALGFEVRALVATGCTQIQIDEPVFARYPDAALSYGFELLEVVLADVPADVTTTLHMCCGYPDSLDTDSYPKADMRTYIELAAAVEASSFDAVSLEDAHRYNPIDLFESFTNTTVVLGSAEIASSRVESPDEIAQRVEAVLAAIGEEQLILAPDCGLGMLSRETAIAKLCSIRAAADRFGD